MVLSIVFRSLPSPKPALWGRDFFISSIKHQKNLAGLLENHTWLNRAEYRLSDVCPLFFYIHSKTACRGFEPFCPCHGQIPEFLGIPGFSCALGWWDTVWSAALFCLFCASFSHPLLSVSNFSVWHIINKSSTFRGHLPCAAGSR